MAPCTSEEVIGAEGFSGISSIAYHVHPPTLVDKVGEPIPFAPDYVDLDFLRHRHVRSKSVESSGAWLESRRYMMGNSDVRLAVATPTEEMNYFLPERRCR